jgi:hypothetical protein
VFGTEATVVGDKQPAASYYVSGKTMQTFTWKLSGVLGTVSFQATLAEDPAEEDWFTVYNLVCTGGNGNGGTDINPASSFTNVTGNFTWLRARVTSFTGGTIQYLRVSY